MSLFGALDISGSGLAAERLRMDVTAENLANAQSTRGADGQPYRRKEVVLRQADGGFGATLNAAMGGSSSGARGVEVAGIAEDTAPNRMVYDPGHPDANAEGYVELPNVDPVTEMVDLITATRAYEANATAIEAFTSQAQRALDILR